MTHYFVSFIFSVSQYIRKKAFCTSKNIKSASHNKTPIIFIHIKYFFLLRSVQQQFKIPLIKILLPKRRKSFGLVSVTILHPSTSEGSLKNDTNPKDFLLLGRIFIRGILNCCCTDLRRKKYFICIKMMGVLLCRRTFDILGSAKSLLSYILRYTENKRNKIMSHSK